MVLPTNVSILSMKRFTYLHCQHGKAARRRAFFTKFLAAGFFRGIMRSGFAESSTRSSVKKVGQDSIWCIRSYARASSNFFHQIVNDNC